MKQNGERSEPKKKEKRKKKEGKREGKGKKRKKEGEKRKKKNERDFASAASKVVNGEAWIRSILSSF